MSLRLIAASLGLSVTTVSRALGNYPDVAEETRRRVFEEALRIGYVPNAMARRLQKGRADAIGVAAPSGPGAMEDSYLYSAFVGAWSRLAELGQDLVLLPAGDDERGTVPTDKSTRAFTRAVEERRVDGVLLVRPHRIDPRVDDLKRAGLPFVMLGAEMRDDPDVIAIGTDNRAAATKICDRLETLGHRGFACVTPTGDYDFTMSRLEHLRETAATRGMSVRATSSYMSEDGGRQATEKLLAASDGPPSALVFLTNRMAIGGLAALAASPWVVGRHVSVITFGDSPTLRWGQPATTAIQSPMFDMSRHAIDALMGLCERRPIEPIRRWAPTLVVRQSDGPPVPIEG